MDVCLLGVLVYTDILQNWIDLGVLLLLATICIKLIFNLAFSIFGEIN